MGLESGPLFAFNTDAGILIKCGSFFNTFDHGVSVRGACFFDTIDVFKTTLEAADAPNKYSASYLAVIALIETLWTEIS
jgi:hypothetical protein